MTTSSCNRTLNRRAGVLLFTLAYPAAGYVVSYIPNPIAPGAIVALNMIFPVLAGHFHGPKSGLVAGGVAHNFNNLLTAIQGSVELAMMKLDAADPAYLNIRRVRDTAMRAADLTRQLLIFSRKQPMAFHPVDINSRIRDVLKILERLIGEDIAVESDLAPDLEPVMADAGNIDQVIINLAVNARDAMPEGGDLTIRTENAEIRPDDGHAAPDGRTGPFVRLLVSDTGVGMTQSAASHIFEPFYSTKEKGKGTGNTKKRISLPGQALQPARAVQNHPIRSGRRAGAPGVTAFEGELKFISLFFPVDASTLLFAKNAIIFSFFHYSRRLRRRMRQ